MHAHNKVLIAGFCLTTLGALLTDAVPFWPIYWSQTAVIENPHGTWVVFAFTTVATAVLFDKLHVGLGLSTHPRALDTAAGRFGAVAFALIGIFNSKINKTVLRMHAVFTLMAGALMIIYITLRCQTIPASQRRKKVACYAIVTLSVVLLLAENCLKKAVPWKGPDVSYTDDGVLFLKLSSIAQYLGICCFVVLTELVPAAHLSDKKQE